MSTTRIRYASRLRVSLGAVTLLTLVRLRAEAAEPLPLPNARGEPPGSDVFVTVREALLRDKPSKESRFLAKLPGGSRLSLIEPGEVYLKVEVVSAALPASEPAKEKELKPRAATGYLSREVASIFPPGTVGTADLVAAGRALASADTHRRLAAAFLLRGSERLRAEGPGDPAVELLLGETAETLAAAGGPFPPGLEVAPRPAAPLIGVPAAPDAPGAPTRWSYTGDAFRRAVSLAGASGSETEEAESWKERARAGLVRQQFPETSSSLPVLWQETAAWLELVESATDAGVVRVSSERLGTGALALGRMLLAAGRLEDLEKLETRVRGTSARVSARPPGDGPGRRLLARAQVLRNMRGTGAASFPQEARMRVGPKDLLVRIDGKLGSLALIEQSSVGATRVGPFKKTAIPILPVPGSLKVAPDGKSAAWIEVVSPSKLVPVVAVLDRDEPAREIAILSSGRPLRDQGLSYVVSTLSGYSKDGQRLGVTIQAWNETPGPEPRYSVVSVATGALLFETSKDTKSFQRLIQ
jgi:hypothetical protein